MADEKLPYVTGYGVINKTLDKVKAAATPDRFTQDFLATKLGLKGGAAKPVIPFLKRVGFLGTDGAPTERYKRFRNPAAAGGAAADALKQGFKPIFDRNEYAQDLQDSELKGLIVEATGMEPASGAVKSILGSFKALRSYANFDQESEDELEDQEEDGDDDAERKNDGDGNAFRGSKLGLSYTINLNLPATSDIAVFNAIFKSLKENLLR